MFKSKKNNSSNYLVCIFSRQKYEIEPKQCHNPDNTTLYVAIKLIMLSYYMEQHYTGCRRAKITHDFSSSLPGCQTVSASKDEFEEFATVYFGNFLNIYTGLSTV
jgi:hypothetical protein